MPICYLETSALLKRYRTEDGTAIVNDHLDVKRPGAILVTSYFTALEVEAVDAIHLATAQRLSHASVVHTIFVTSDRELLRAARGEQLETLSPHQHKAGYNIGERSMRGNPWARTDTR